MPKIPTFTSQVQITPASPEIKSQFQIPLTGGTAGGLTTGLEKLNEYYIAKQNLQDTVEAKQKFYEIKGTTDSFLGRQKNNYNEEDAIKNFTNDFNEYSKLELAKVSSATVRDKLKQELDLELGQNILKIKKQSFDALEKESQSIYNTGQTNDAASYEMNDGNTLEQARYKDQMIRRAEEYSNQWKLSDIDKQLKINSVLSTIFLSDVKTKVMNSDNPNEVFKQIYESNNAQSISRSQDLSKLLIETYKNNISNIAIKGDINSDYDKAVKMANQLESLRTPDGNKVVSDKNLADWSSFKEKILSEKVGHEELKLKASQNLEINNYLKEETDNLEGAFINKITMATDAASNLAREKATQAKTEFNSTIQNWLFTNSDKTNAEKKQYITDLKRNLIEKYNDNSIKLENISAFDTYQKPLNIHRTFETYKNDYENYIADPSAPNYLKTEAKLRGFFDKKGNPDVRSYLNYITPILKQRLNQE